MSLNIKNEETCRMAGELARLTGETMTGAITIALRERLERVQRESPPRMTVEEMLAFGRETASMLHDGPSAEEHGVYLYDDDGLPK